MICSKYDHSVTIQGLRVMDSSNNNDSNSVLYQSPSEVCDDYSIIHYYYSISLFNIIIQYYYYEY